MAVRKDSDTPEAAQFTVTNGDIDALRKIKEQYNLKDDESVLVFALGVLSQGNGQPVSVRREDGSPRSLVPSNELKK